MRWLVSVEALGLTTVICVDKAGTLTRGRFALDEHVVLAGDDDALLVAAGLHGATATARRRSTARPPSATRR